MTRAALSAMIDEVMDEIENTTATDKYQIFCDLDGVLVSFTGGIEDAIRREPPENASSRYIKAHAAAREVLGDQTLEEKHLNKNDGAFLKPVHNFMMRVMMNDRRFWMNLKWAPGGQELWDYIKKYDPIILSKPTDLQAVIGKKKWVKDNLGLTGGRVQIRYNKSNYANHEGKTGLLIDDREIETSAYDAAGGETILFKNVGQAIRDLKEYGFD